MKTFMQFIGIREETASYISEKKPDQKTKDADNTAIVVAALKHMLKTRPEVIIAFLNQHRMDPDIREILNNHNLLGLHLFHLLSSHRITTTYTKTKALQWYSKKHHTYF